MKNIKENFLFIPYYAYDDEHRFEKFQEILVGICLILGLIYQNLL